LTEPPEGDKNPVTGRTLILKPDGGDAMANARRIVLLLVFGGVIAFVLPYLLPTEGPLRIEPAILATVLFAAAFFLAYAVDRLLRVPRRKTELRR
jgi:hypothetical protein